MLARLRRVHQGTSPNSSQDAPHKDQYNKVKVEVSEGFSEALEANALSFAQQAWGRCDGRTETADYLSTKLNAECASPGFLWDVFAAKPGMLFGKNEWKDSTRSELSFDTDFLHHYIVNEDIIRYAFIVDGRGYRVCIIYRMD